MNVNGLNHRLSRMLFSDQVKPVRRLRLAANGTSGVWTNLRRHLARFVRCSLSNASSDLVFTGLGETVAGPSTASNADAFAVHESSGCFAIADGFGRPRTSSDFAQRCTQTALDCLQKNCRDSGSLSSDMGRAMVEVMEYANRLANTSLQHPHSLGASLAAVVCRKDTVALASIGSCRVYLVRNGKLKQLTQDHTLAVDLRLAMGKTSINARQYSKFLTKHLGDGTSFRSAVTTVCARPGDQLLLLTDGVYRELNEASLLRIVQSRQATSIPQSLILAAQKAGSYDDCAAVLIQVESSEQPRGGELLQTHASVQPLKDLRIARSVNDFAVVAS